MLFAAPKSYDLLIDLLADWLIEDLTAEEIVALPEPQTTKAEKSDAFSALEFQRHFNRQDKTHENFNPKTQ